MGKRRGHGEGSIYQRDDGRWCASIDLGYVNGRRRRRVIYGPTRKAVADQLKALHQQQAAGVVITERQTVQQFLKRWLEEVVKQRNKIRTFEGYERIVELYLNPHLGRIALTKLTPEYVQQLINVLAAKGLAPNTVRNVRAVLRRALNQALKWGLVARNVAALVDTPRIEQQAIAPMDEQQARALLAAVAGDRLEALYRIALSLGLRRGEVLGLKWEDVDLERATIRIVRAIQWTRTQGMVFSTPKTKGSSRTLHLPETLLSSLRQHKARQDEERKSPRWQECGMVFTTTKGTPLHPDNITHRFKAALRKAGLPETTRFHDLRHSCATLLLAQGVPPRVVMEILGHDQISTTMNIYAHVLPESLRAAAAALDALLAKEDEESPDGDHESGSEDDDATGADEKTGDS